MTASDEPQPDPPDETDQHYRLWQRVKSALLSAPASFSTETFIAGVMATDIHTLGAVLGATIEEQVVKTLNQMRDVWDTDNRYPLYSFNRQAQVFPDVLLKRPPTEDTANDILMGIELKSWYLLAKEGEPSFRFVVTQSSCAKRDLAVVVPWALSRVISGSPIVFEPYIVEARYAAQYRNYYWQELRDAQSSTDIVEPTGAQPYPTKSDEIADRPVSDSGNNFGRLARTGMMDQYVASVKQELLGGITVEQWRAFLRTVREES